QGPDEAVIGSGQVTFRVVGGQTVREDEELGSHIVRQVRTVVGCGVEAGPGRLDARAGQPHLTKSMPQKRQDGSARVAVFNRALGVAVSVRWRTHVNGRV